MKKTVITFSEILLKILVALQAEKGPRKATSAEIFTTVYSLKPNGDVSMQ